MAEFMFFGGVSLFGPQSATRAWSQTAVAAYQSLTKGSEFMRMADRIFFGGVSL